MLTNGYIKMQGLLLWYRLSVCIVFLLYILASEIVLKCKSWTVKLF
jgi:hypothetical protein